VKNQIRVLLFLFFPAFLSAQSPSFDLGPWAVSQDDSPEYSRPDVDDSTWERKDTPFSVSSGRGENSRWFRTRVSRTDFPVAQPFLLLKRIEATVSVYFNGVEIYRDGEFPPDYHFGTGKSHTIRLPVELFQDENVIAIRTFRDSGSFIFHTKLLSDENAANFEKWVITFLNEDLYSIFAFINLFIALYLFFIWFFNKKDVYNFWYAVTNFSFYVYFLRIGDQMEYMPFLHFSGFAKGFLSIAFFSLFVFYTLLFKMWRSSKLRIPLGAISLLFFLLLFLYTPDYTTIMKNFTLSLIPGQIIIFMIITMAFISWRKGNKEAGIILLGSAWGLGFGSHDIIMMVGETTPPVWLQGVGIFGFNIAIFIYIAFMNAKIQKDLFFSRSSLESRQTQLSQTFSEITNLSDDLTKAILALQSAMASAQSVISGFSKNTSTIAYAIQDQSAYAQQTRGNVEELLKSIKSVYNDIEGQGTQIQASVEAMNQMFQNIEIISENLEATSVFTKNLAENIQKSNSAVEISRRSMEKIRQGSENISSIVETVTELADRTNLLSMNAGIEAAHAGNAGKGFAVVAQEIKKLADSSSSRAKEIALQVKDILHSIQQGASTTLEVQQMLASVQEKSSSSAEQVQTIYKSILQQKASGEKISQGLMILEKSGVAIKKQSDSQSESSAAIGTKINSLTEALMEIQDRTDELGKENDHLVTSAESLREVGTKLTSVVEKLKNLITAEAGA